METTRLKNTKGKKPDITEGEHLDFMLGTSIYMEVKSWLNEHRIIQLNDPYWANKMQIAVVVNPSTLKIIENLLEKGEIQQMAYVFWTSRKYMDYCEYEIHQIRRIGRVKEPSN